MKTKRHAKILELIHQSPINTQEELLRGLREHGFDVTQATVSRDIKELRLVKTLDSSGRYRYATAQKDTQGISSKFYNIFSEAVASVDYAGNIAVVKCIPGMAQAACAALDSLHWDGVIGTLAGDDTIFIITRNEEKSVSLAAELKKYISR
ncbi:MAG: arginine repressor [Clostridiales bacterium]|nr:arginine repressor [Clostridiales bacterium]